MHQTIGKISIIYLLTLLIVLLALSPIIPANAQTETPTPTVTYTPIATGVSVYSTGVYSTTIYALPSGASLAVESRATMGETLLIIVLFCILAVTLARWVYDLAYQWGR